MTGEDDWAAKVKSIRTSLGFTQEEFADRYSITIGRLRDWEQGRTQPDKAMQAYLLSLTAMSEPRVSDDFLRRYAEGAHDLPAKNLACDLLTALRQIAELTRRAETAEARTAELAQELAVVKDQDIRAATILADLKACLAEAEKERDEAREERDNFIEQAAIRSDSYNELQRVMAMHNETCADRDRLAGEIARLRVEGTRKQGLQEALEAIGELSTAPFGHDDPQVRGAWHGGFDEAVKDAADAIRARIAQPAPADSGSEL